MDVRVGFVRLRFLRSGVASSRRYSCGGQMYTLSANHCILDSYWMEEYELWGHLLTQLQLQNGLPNG